MVAPFLNVRVLPKIFTATLRSLQNSLLKEHLIAFGVRHFVYNRQPHVVFGKVSSAITEI